MSRPQTSGKSGILALMAEARAFVLIPLLAGIPFLLVGLSEAYKTVQLEHSYVSTRGTVEQLTCRWSTSRRGMER